MSAVLGGVPCLIREIFYAPPCPESVARLFEVALVRHNEGCYEDAINLYLDAQSTWENHILHDTFKDTVENANSLSMLALLMKKEKDKNDDLLAQRDEDLVRQARIDVQKLEQIEKEAEAAAAAAAAKSALNEDDAEIKLPFKVHPTDSSGSTDPGQGNVSAAPLYTKADLKKFLDEQNRRQEIRNAASAMEAAKSLEQQEKKVLAMYECPHLIPPESHIFIQLSIGSAFQSGGSDEQALRTFLFALELCETKLTGNPAHHPVTASAHCCLGSVYFHTGQYDFAADHFFRCLEIREQLLPSGHPDIAAALNNIACVLHVLARANDALVFLYRAAEIFMSQFDDTHPRRQTVDGNIRRAKAVAMRGAVPPPVPFQSGIVPPLIPGARRAVEFLKPKAKKAKAKDAGKKK